MDVLDKISFMRVENILLSADLTLMTEPIDRHSVSIVEPLHLFHLGIIETLEERTVTYVSSSELQSNPLLPKKHQKKFTSCKSSLLNR